MLLATKIVAQITPCLRRSADFLASTKPLFISYSFQCSMVNKSVENWIATLPENQRKTVEYIQKEITVNQVEGKKMPLVEDLLITDYAEMLEMSCSRRYKYYEYLHAVRTADSNEKMKKIIRTKTYEEKKKLGLFNTPATNHIEYGVGKSSLILRVNRQTMSSWRNLKLNRAILANEQPLIFDCGFCDKMTKYEIQNTAKQIAYSFSINRLHRTPFVLNFCNIDKNSFLWHQIQNVMANFTKLPLKIHTADVTEVFPREQLVYLSPDAEEMLDEFNADHYYVIGGIVDRGQRKPLTFAKTKKLNIRSARLPLEKYIKFHSHKTLTLDQMTKILLELRTSRDWAKALRHIPGRKILGSA